MFKEPNLKKRRPNWRNVSYWFLLFSFKWFYSDSPQNNIPSKRLSTMSLILVEQFTTLWNYFKKKSQLTLPQCGYSSYTRYERLSSLAFQIIDLKIATWMIESKISKDQILFKQNFMEDWLHFHCISNCWSKDMSLIGLSQSQLTEFFQFDRIMIDIIIDPKKTPSYSTESFYWEKSLSNPIS